MSTKRVVPRLTPQNRYFSINIFGSIQQIEPLFDPDQEYEAMKEVKRDYLVYTCETERFDKNLYFPKLNNKACLVRWVLLLGVLIAIDLILIQLNRPVLWIVVGGISLCFAMAYLYFAHLRASWLREGVVYEVTSARVRSMTGSGRWLSECDYNGKSIKVISLKNGFSEIHIQNKNRDTCSWWDPIFPPDLGRSPCVFVMYQIDNADYFVSLM